MSIDKRNLTAADAKTVLQVGAWQKTALDSLPPAVINEKPQGLPGHMRTTVGWSKGSQFGETIKIAPEGQTGNRDHAHNQFRSAIGEIVGVFHRFGLAAQATDLAKAYPTYFGGVLPQSTMFYLYFDPGK